MPTETPTVIDHASRIARVQSILDELNQQDADNGLNPHERDALIRSKTLIRCLTQAVEVRKQAAVTQNQIADGINAAVAEATQKTKTKGAASAQ